STPARSCSARRAAGSEAEAFDRPAAAAQRAPGRPPAAKARVERGAPVREPVLLGDIDRQPGTAAPLGLGLSKLHELVVGLDLVGEEPQDELGDDRIVEEAEPGRLIGYPIVRVHEVGEGVKDALRVLRRQLPGLVLEHLDELAEPVDAGTDEAVRLSGSGRLDQPARGREDLVTIDRFRDVPRLVEHRAKAFEILVSELELDLDAHRGRLRSFEIPKSVAGKPVPAPLRLPATVREGRATPGAVRNPSRRAPRSLRARPGAVPRKAIRSRRAAGRRSRAASRSRPDR